MFNVTLNNIKYGILTMLKIILIWSIRHDRLEIRGIMGWKSKRIENAFDPMEISWPILFNSLVKSMIQ